MKRGFVAVSSLLALAVASQSVQAKTLEEVLKEKGVITEADYNDIVKSAPKTKPVDYKLGKGFTFTSGDEKYQLTVGGNMQLLYTYQQNDGTDKAPKSEWKLRRIKTLFSGHALTKDLTYKMNLNWAELQTDGKSSKVMEEIFINYRLMDEAQLLMGQDKVQYGRQEINSSSAQEFVDRSFVVNAFKPSYDIGLNLHGSVMKGLFKYDAEWVGGKGQSIASSTNNNAYNFRLETNPLGEMKNAEADIDMSPKPLFGVGASYYHNTLKKTGATTFETNNNSYAGSSGWLGKNAGQFSTTANVDIKTMEADAAFKWMGLYLQGEYFWGQGTGLGATAGTDANVISNGIYTQAGYMVLPKQVELAVRYAWMDYNRALPNNNQTEVTGAISWYIKGHNLKIQGDVTKQHIQQNKVVAGVNTNNPLDNTIFRVQTQINF